jgi:hypothetical protein
MPPRRSDEATFNRVRSRHEYCLWFRNEPFNPTGD